MGFLRCWLYPWDEIKIFMTVGPVSEIQRPIVVGHQPRHRPTRKPDMAVTLIDSQQVAYAIAFQDKKGNPATPPTGVPAWTVSDPTILAVAPAADGLSATISAVGALGHAQVQIAAGPLNGTIDFQVVSGNASQIVPTQSGPPAEQP